MVGYSLYGVYYHPAGYITNMHYVRFRSMGKQYCEGEPPNREPPLVLVGSLPSLTMVGIVVTEPMTGRFFQCTKTAGYKGALDLCKTSNTAKTITDSIFVGTSVEFEPRRGVHDTAERNLFFGGDECTVGCPSAKMVTFGGNGGTLSVLNNVAMGGLSGFLLRAACSEYESWGGNVAIGNMVGFDVEAGCTSLRLEGYRNSAGVTAATAEISNFLMVENGLAVTPGETVPWPDAINNLRDYLDGGAELSVIANATIIGKSPTVSGSVRSANCDIWSGGGNHPYNRGFYLGWSPPLYLRKFEYFRLMLSFSIF